MIIDLSEVESMAELHQLLAKQLNFPEYYGNNLDALYDQLGEMTGELVFVHGERFNGFRRVCMDAAAENPNLTVKFGGEDEKI